MVSEPIYPWPPVLPLGESLCLRISLLDSSALNVALVMTACQNRQETRPMPCRCRSRRRFGRSCRRCTCIDQCTLPLEYLRQHLRRAPHERHVLCPQADNDAPGMAITECQRTALWSCSHRGKSSGIAALGLAVNKRDYQRCSWAKGSFLGLRRT